MKKIIVIKILSTLVLMLCLITSFMFSTNYSIINALSNELNEEKEYSVGTIDDKANKVSQNQNEVVNSNVKKARKANESTTSNYDSLFDNITYPADIENYDYFELLEEEITPFINWLETIFDLDNPLDEEFVDNNFNKLMLKAIDEDIISDVFNKPQARFGGTTHEQITMDGLSLLLEDNKNAAYNFYSSYIQTLKYGSKQPDVDEMFGGHHYYVYGTTLSDGYYQNRIDDYSISARTRFEEHYYTAINAYKNNKISVAMEELGRALHYLQDTASTPHSAGLVSNFLNLAHKRYENWVKLAYPGNQNYVASSASEFYSTVLNLDNPGLILNQIAGFSYGYRGILLDHSKDTTDLNYSYYVTVASACLPYSQKMTAAVLNRFYEDITNSTRKTSYIKDGSIYYIKNVGTGKYIDVKSWSIENNAVTHPYDFHGDTNQQFRAEMQDDGSFRFTPMHVQYKKLHISRMVDSFERLNITGIGHKFRPVYYKNGTYRIIPEYDSDLNNTSETRYYKYPINQNGNKIEIRPSEIWDPSDSNYYWKFEEAPSISSGETQTYLGKDETKRVIIKVATTGNYDIETLGSVDTYFVNLAYRIGTGNINLEIDINNSNDDGGEGLNAKYSNVHLVSGRTYILTLKGFNSSSAGPITIKVSGNGPNERIENKSIRTDPYTITDGGRFNNSYDTINFYTIFGESVSSLKQKGYTKVSITLEFYAYEINDGYQYFWIYDGDKSSSTSLYGQQFEHNHGDQDSTHRKYIFSNIEFDLNAIKSNSVYVRYGASGSSEDDWVNYNLNVQIKIY